MDYNLLEESVLNYVKNISIDETRADPKYQYSQIRIPVITLHNDGQIDSIYGKLPNKCFFISVANGINKYCESIKKGLLVTPYQLMSLSKFYDLSGLVDTDNPIHREALRTLVKELDICLLMHIGRKEGDKWYTTPDPCEIFGNQKSIIQIRVLNMGAHFEYITTSDIEFIRAPRTMNDERLNLLQLDAWKHYQ